MKTKFSLKNFWKEKTLEQKVFLIVTIIFLALDLYIFVGDYFEGTRGGSYVKAVIIQMIVKFIVLSSFNKNNLNNNAVASLPYIGGIYAIFFFLFKQKIP